MEKRIIEISGVKFEIDLRNAKKVENYKVGDKIKILLKDYSDTFNSHVGIIIGFDEFKETPTINICYLKESYSDAEIKFMSFNDKTKNAEIAPCYEHEFTFEKAGLIEKLDQEIEKKKLEMEDMEKKKYYFLKHFDKHFEIKDK